MGPRDVYVYGFLKATKCPEVVDEDLSLVPAAEQG